MTDVRRRVVEDYRYGARHIESRDGRGLAVAHRQRQLVGFPHASSGQTQKKAFEEHRRPHRDDWQARP
jgi:hypothetical protein